MVYLNVQCCKYIWMACSTYSFVWHKLKKKLPQNFCIFKLFFAAAVSTWLKPPPEVELDFFAVGIYPLLAITHKHLWPLIIAEWPLPLLPVELCRWWRKCVATFKLTLCSIDSQHCDLLFIIKTVDLATEPQSHNDQTRSIHLTHSDWLLK